MLNLTIAQALSVWTDLLEAEFGCNGFGSDTAEIYAYRLQPSNPATESSFIEDESNFTKEAKREQDLIASRNLYELLCHFRDERKVDVFVGCGRMYDGDPLDERLLKYPFTHRTQVRIKKQNKT